MVVKKVTGVKTTRRLFSFLFANVGKWSILRRLPAYFSISFSSIFKNGSGCLYCFFVFVLFVNLFIPWMQYLYTPLLMEFLFSQKTCFNKVPLIRFLFYSTIFLFVYVFLYFIKERFFCLSMTDSFVLLFFRRIMCACTVFILSRHISL